MARPLLFLLLLDAATTNTALLREGTAYVASDRKRLVVFRGQEEECQIFGSDVERRLDETAVNRVRWVDGRDMGRIVRQCEAIHARLFSSSPSTFFGEPTLLLPPPQQQSERRRDGPVAGGEGKNSIWSWNVFDRVFILPGTKWCGQGDIALGYNDLGYHSEEDKCCRSHDICLEATGEFLAPGQCKNGLCNHSPFTRSPCGCDRQLSTCLRKINSRISDALGRTFFNIAGVSCYEYDYPVKLCLEYVTPPKNFVPPWLLSASQINSAPSKPRCKRYKLDESKHKTWQFFQIFYDETNQRSEEREPRSMSAVAARDKRQQMSMLQQVIMELFLRIVDPE